MVRDFGQFGKGFVTADERAKLIYFLLENVYDLLPDAYDTSITKALEALLVWGNERDVYKNSDTSLASLDRLYTVMRKALAETHMDVFKAAYGTPKLAAGQNYSREIRGIFPIVLYPRDVSLRRHSIPECVRITIRLFGFEQILAGPAI